MAIVWPDVCRDIRVSGPRCGGARPSCPSCSRPMRFWSGYERSVRVDDRFVRVWVRRAQCLWCRCSNALIPSFLLAHRQDSAAVIGDALGSIANGASIGATAGRWRVPFTTVRGWWRRFRARASVWWSGFAAVTVELGGTVQARWPAGPPAATVAAIGWAHRAAAV